MSTDLVVLGQQTALQNAGGLGFDDEEGIAPSYMELVQRTSQVEGALPGKFRDKESNQHFDNLEFIPLEFSTSRVLFPPGGDLTQQPLCRSNDAIRPVPGVIDQQSSLCATCPRSSWDNYVKGSGQGMPDCKEKMRMLFVDRATFLPYYLTVTGKSLQAMSGFKRVLKKYAHIGKMKGEPVNIFDFTAKMSVLSVKGQKGSYYLATFGSPVMVKEESRGTFGPMYQQLVLNRKQVVQQNQDNQTIDAEYVEA